MLQAEIPEPHRVVVQPVMDLGQGTVLRRRGQRAMKPTVHVNELAEVACLDHRLISGKGLFHLSQV